MKVTCEAQRNDAVVPLSGIITGRAGKGMISPKGENDLKGGNNRTIVRANLAVDQPATQSSTSPWSTSQDKAADARVANNGDTHSKRFFHTSIEKEPWWQIDLGKVFLLETIVIFNRLEVPERLCRFSVLRSLDLKRWFNVFRKEDNHVFDVLEVDIVGEHIARYVRVRLDGIGFLHFRECQIFGTPVSAVKRVILKNIDDASL